jgi:hypothetical protein
MKFRILGAASGIVFLPVILAAQTPTTPYPTPLPNPPTNPTPQTRDSTMRDSTMKDSTAVPVVPLSVPTTETPKPTPTPTPIPTPELTPTPTPTPTTDTILKTEPVPANPISGSNANTTMSGTSTGVSSDVNTMSSSSAAAGLSSTSTAVATGSAFAMGTRNPARDSLVGPRPVPPSDGTTCPWGCPTSSGTAGLTGPQFLALQQELRDRKCGNSHVTGRLDAATRVAIRNCAKKMGVANNAAAVLVGFDIGFGASDVNLPSSGSEPKQED